MTLLETMALSRPIAATPVGGVPDMLGFGTGSPCGWEVPVGDVHALERAIRLLLEDTCLANQLGRNGRNRVIENYGADHGVQLLLSILEGLHDRHRGQ
jgi:glycosyltransferase involved in cell wall biosynthesis